jgi:hypothetical protein|nr:MAG TPA: hypothetical protein [Caudoviricetes sp.]
MHYQEHKTVSFKGYCDYLSDYHSIDATYAKIQTLGMTHPGAKLTSVYCEFSDECQRSDRDCPIIQQASQNHEW